MQQPQPVDDHDDHGDHDEHSDAGDTSGGGGAKGAKASDNGRMKRNMTSDTIPTSLRGKREFLGLCIPPDEFTDGEICNAMFVADKQKTMPRSQSVRAIDAALRTDAPLSGSVKLDRYTRAHLLNRNQPDLGSSQKDSNTGTLANARSVSGLPKMVDRQNKAKRSFDEAHATDRHADGVLREYTEVEIAAMDDGEAKTEICQRRDDAATAKKRARLAMLAADVDYLSAPEDLAVKVSSLPNANRSHMDVVYAEAKIPLSQRKLAVPATPMDAFKTCVEHSFRKAGFSLRQEERCMHECLKIEDEENREALQAELKSAYDTIFGIHEAFLQRAVSVAPVFRPFVHEPLDGSLLNVPAPPAEPAPDAADPAPAPAPVEPEPAPELEPEPEAPFSQIGFGSSVISFASQNGKSGSFVIPGVQETADTR